MNYNDWHLLFQRVYNEAVRAYQGGQVHKYHLVTYVSVSPRQDVSRLVKSSLKSSQRASDLTSVGGTELRAAKQCGSS